MLKPINFSGEKTAYLAPSWDEMNQLAFTISQKIIQDQLHFDRIITLAKGGWPMTRTMVDFLSVSQVASIGIKFYSGINQRLKHPQVYQDLPANIDIKSENILLFDDVADSGESLIFAKKHLLNHHPQSITTATLFYKPHSKFKPDYFALQTDTWIIFPYDAVAEAINTLAKKWLTNLPLKKVLARLDRLGVDPLWSQAYLQGRSLDSVNCHFISKNDK